MAYLFRIFFFERTDEQTDTQTNGRTDGRSDYIMPQILFGGIKSIEGIAMKLYTVIKCIEGI